MDTRIPIEIPPGIWRNGTKYQAKGRWYDGHLVRFFDGTIRPVGGWRRMMDDTSTPLAALTGIPRAAIAYRVDGAVVQAIGTVSKLYAVQAGSLHDITPAGFTAGTDNTGPAGASTIGNYSAGDYGVGLYGVGSPTAGTVDASLWSLDNFGNDLVGISTTDGKLYVWAGDPAVLPAVAAGSPTGSAVVVTPERFLVVLGAGGDVRKVQWPSQETTDDWTPTALNTAGDFSLATNGRLLAGRVTKGQTLLFTDADVHTMSYIGGTFVYRFTRVGENCGLLAPNAIVTAGGRALWMSTRGFFGYDGFVKPIRCDVEDYIFSDFNRTQAIKCWGQSVSAYNEAWFFYPSANSQECDRYAVYNYVEDHWTIGELPRTAGFDRGAVSNPVMADATGALYEHELPLDPAVVDSRSDSPPFLESGPAEVGNGDRIAQVQKFYPDAVNVGDVALSLFVADAPLDPETEVDVIYPLTVETDMRVATRLARFRIEERALSDWRVGKLLFGIVPSSRR